MRYWGHSDEDLLDRCFFFCCSFFLSFFFLSFYRSFFSFIYIAVIKQVLKVKDHKRDQIFALKIIRNKKRFHHQALVEVKILEHLMTKV